MKSILSFTLAANKEETATTILSAGLTYIAFPPSPKAAYECSASSITHHKYKRIIYIGDFQNFPVLRDKENFLKNFSQNAVNSALCGVVGSERTYQRVWDTSRLPAQSALNGCHWRPTPQQAKSVRPAAGENGQIYGIGERETGTESRHCFQLCRRSQFPVCYTTETVRCIGTQKDGTALVIGAIPPNLKLLPSNRKLLILLAFCPFPAVLPTGHKE